MSVVAVMVVAVVVVRGSWRDGMAAVNGDGSWRWWLMAIDRGRRRGRDEGGRHRE
jgi:hypothetical protein